MEYIKTQLNQEILIEDIVSIHYFEYTKDFAYSGEFHDFWELVYADKEELFITAGAHELTLTSGELYLHRPMEFHNLRCNGERAANSFIISFSSPSTKLLNLAGKIFRCPAPCKKLMGRMIKEAENAFSTPLGQPRTAQLIRKKEQIFGAEQMILIHLEEFLIRLIREDGDAEKLPQRTFDEDANSQLAKICEFLSEQVENRISFGQLCQHFSMSESSMKKLFREGIGSGAMDFYNRCKIDRAKKMIREKEKNFTEIASRLGYNSVQYFSRHFKQSTGMTPSQYEESIENMA